MANKGDGKMTKRYGTTEYAKKRTALAALLIAFAVLFAYCPVIGTAGTASASTPTVASDIKLDPGPSSITLTWSKGSATTIYSIKVKGGGVTRIANYKESKGSGIVSGLSDNTSYDVAVTPISGGVRGEVKELSCRTTAKHSALPSSSVKTSDLTSITLGIGSYSKDDSTKAPEKYVVKYSKNQNMSGARTVLVSPSSSSYRVSGLNSESQYFFEFGSFYTANGSRIYSELTKKYSGKTKVASLGIKSANTKSLLQALQTTNVGAGTTINIQLPFVVASSQKQFFYDLYALESIYQPYFQRAGSNVEIGFYNNSNIVGFKKTKTYATAKARGQKADKKINAIVKKAKRYKSKKKQVVYVNNQLRKACNYDYTFARADNWNPYGCLVRKKAVCLGYSEAFYACMYRLKIPCKFQINKTGSHIWNKVKVNGKWTHIDVTWNDCVKKNKYIWMSDKKTNKIKSHKFK